MAFARLVRDLVVNLLSKEEDALTVEAVVQVDPVCLLRSRRPVGDLPQGDGGLKFVRETRAVGAHILSEQAKRGSEGASREGKGGNMDREERGLSTFGTPMGIMRMGEALAAGVSGA
eukprot:scaffold2771_cov31-Tisochrysis_lutea.AAC.3